MRQYILTFALLTWGLGASAAQTVTIPISIVPGSLTFSPRGIVASPGPSPATFPLSQNIVASLDTGECTSGYATITANIVNGGLEIEAAGFMSGPHCILGGLVSFDVEIVVPELGGTVTTARLIPEVTTFGFVNFLSVSANWITDKQFTSSIPAIPVDESHSHSLTWAPWPNTVPVSTTVTPMHWIPGDTIRFNVQTQLEIESGDGRNAQGTARIRWIYRTTVPEPSASLSLPLSVAWLAGLSMIRGGA